MATDLRVGTITPASFAIGADAVTKIYIGSTQVYPQCMAKITSYPSGTLNLNDYLIGTDRENENVTRSYKVSEVINTIIAAAPGAIGTVTSISTDISTKPSLPVRVKQAEPL